MYSQAFTAETYGNPFRVEPGQKVDFAASTSDLNNATLYLQESVNGFVYTAARDQAGTAVSTIVGDAGSHSISAILGNDTGSVKYFRVFVDATGVIAGTVTATAELRSDAAKIGEDAGPKGAGTTGAAVIASSVVREGGMIRTRLYIDIQGLNGGGTAGDIIGNDGVGAAFLCQITDEVNGEIVAGTITCLEVPTTSDPDVDLWSANENTGVEDTAISALTGELQLTNGGDHTLARTLALILLPLSGQYLYLVGGDTTAGTYGAGKFVIELIGIPQE